MCAGLLMMFAVYGMVMMIGAIVGENDAVFGNALMTLVFTALTVAAFSIGMAQRKRAHQLFSTVIENELSTHGYVDAIRFSKGAGVTLDDARDILDRMARHRGWHRTELTEYNAEYR